jgi:hypothetical protein
VRALIAKDRGTVERLVAGHVPSLDSKTSFAGLAVLSTDVPEEHQVAVLTLLVEVKANINLPSVRGAASRGWQVTRSHACAQAINPVEKVALRACKNLLALLIKSAADVNMVRSPRSWGRGAHPLPPRGPRRSPTARRRCRWPCWPPRQARKRATRRLSACC